MNYIKVLLVGALCSLFVSCNEEVYVATVTVEDPIVTDFEPKSGEVGTEVTIYGENLHIIKSVAFGGGDAPIKYRISDTELVVTVSTDTRSGGVEVINNFDKSASYDTESFTVTYQTPVVTSVDNPVTENKPIETEVTDGSYGEVGQMLVFEGEYLHFVDEVQFVTTTVDAETSEEVETVYAGAIVTQRENELVVELPLMDVSADTNLRLTYFNGTEDTYLDRGLYHVIVLIPQITSEIPTTLTKYEPMTIEGFNLDLITSMYVQNEAEEIVKLRILSKSSNVMTVDIATNFFSSDYNTDYTEGDATPILGFTGAVYMIYNGDKLDEVSGELALYGNPIEARYSVYEDLYASGRSNAGYAEADDMSFIDFDMGMVHSVCSAPGVKADIDAIFYDTNNGGKLYGADAATSVVKNYKCGGVSLTTLEADWAALYANVVDFRVLDPTDTDQGALITAYEEKTLVELTAAVVGDIETASSTPMLYEGSVDECASSKAYTESHPYILIYSTTGDKYGIMKLKGLTTNPTTKFTMSMTFDLLWSL